ncbi:quinone oxidoreductase family protein [Gordonia terrae]
MRAFVLPAEGLPPILTSSVEVPDIDGGEVLVRVAASSVNPHDIAVSSGAASRYMTYRYPVVLGSDFAGVIETVGKDVDDLSPGDRVFGVVRELVAERGTFADFVAVPREWVHQTPDSVTDSDAGALGLAAIAGLRCVQAIAPEPNDVVLVIGAAGGIGSYVVQLLAARGVSTVATACAGDQTTHVEQMGANHVIDWTTGSLVERVREVRPEGVSAIIDLVNRDRTTLAAIADEVLLCQGSIASTGHAAPNRPRCSNVQVSVDQSALREISNLVEEGSLHVPVSQTFDLNSMDQAFTAISEGVTGKIAIAT